ncbi:MAG: CSLREA domain-containing protein, partial [Planctomycetales bacterium]
MKRKWLRSFLGGLASNDKNNRRSHRRLSIESLEPRCLLTALTVNSLEDITLAADGKVTLREAIIAANTDSMTDLGQTGSGADQITFDPSLFSGGPQNLLLGGAELAITSALTITGPGASTLTIDAQDNSRIFNIDDGNAGQVAVGISGLTLTGGGNVTLGLGGAIHNSENLTLSTLTVSDNSAGGGGGIYNSGRLTITDSTISGNTANSGGYNEPHGGGGIRNSGTLTVTSSTISGNISNDDF